VAPVNRFGSVDEMIVALRTAGRAESQRKRPAPGAAKRPAPGAARDQKAEKRPQSPAERKAAEQRRAAEQRKVAQAWAPPAATGRSIGSYLLGGGIILAAVAIGVYFIIWPPSLIPLTPPPTTRTVAPEGDAGPEVAKQKTPARPRRRRRPPSADAGAKASAAFEENIKAQSQPLPPRTAELVAQGNEALQAKRYSVAKRLAPGSPEIARGLGLAYMYDGQTGAAVAELERYLELSPTAPDAPYVKSTVRSLRE